MKHPAAFSLPQRKRTAWPAKGSRSMRAPSSRQLWFRGAVRRFSVTAFFVQLPFGFEPEFQFAIDRPASLLPEFVRTCAHLAAPHHAQQLSPQLLSKAPEALDRGLVLDERGRSRCEFNLVLDLLLLVHCTHCRKERTVSEPVLFRQ